jgi:hypothetical protein
LLRYPGVVERELPAVRVEVKDLAVAVEIDRDTELLPSLCLGESAAQDIEEEPLAEVPVLRGLDGVADRPDKGCSTGEDLFGLENVCGDECSAVLGDIQIGIVDFSRRCRRPS